MTSHVLMNFWTFIRQRTLLEFSRLILKKVNDMDKNVDFDKICRCQGGSITAVVFINFEES